MSQHPQPIVRQPRRMLAELRRDVDRYRDALVRLVIACEQHPQSMPLGIVHIVTPEQFAKGQAEMLATAAKDARAVFEAPGWVARMCEPAAKTESAP